MSEWVSRGDEYLINVLAFGAGGVFPKYSTTVEIYQVPCTSFWLVKMGAIICVMGAVDYSPTTSFECAAH